jgi:hypothetical protein
MHAKYLLAYCCFTFQLRKMQKCFSCIHICVCVCVCVFVWAEGDRGTNNVT